jgi:DHA1 family bicyclomycin/chloramphenicol resistance-like MFS transporter
MVLTSVPKRAVDPLISQAPFSLKEYKIVFQNPKTRYSILTCVFFILGYWVFIAISPILYMEGLGVDLKHFGFYQGAIAGVFSIGSFLSPLFLRMFDQEKCFKVSVWLNALCSVGILLLVVGQSQSPLLITVLMVIDSLTMVLPMVIFFPLILNIIPEAKGRISASITGGRLIGSAFFVQFAGYFYNGTFGSIGLILVGITIVGLFFYLKLLQTDPAFFATVQPVTSNR